MLIADHEHLRCEQNLLGELKAVQLWRRLQGRFGLRAGLHTVLELIGDGQLLVDDGLELLRNERVLVGDELQLVDGVLGLVGNVLEFVDDGPHQVGDVQVFVVGAMVLVGTGQVGSGGGQARTVVEVLNGGCIL